MIDGRKEISDPALVRASKAQLKGLERLAILAEVGAEEG